MLYSPRRFSIDANVAIFAFRNGDMLVFAFCNQKGDMLISCVFCIDVLVVCRLYSIAKINITLLRTCTEDTDGYVTCMRDPSWE